MNKIDGKSKKVIILFQSKKLFMYAKSTELMLSFLSTSAADRAFSPAGKLRIVPTNISHI